MMSPPGARGDAALVAAARTGDDRAFTELMRRHKEPLYSFVRHYVGDSDEALDLLQETFVAAWVGLARFDARRPLLAWLRAIALNKCRDWSRRRQVRRFFFSAAQIDANVGQASAHADASDSDRNAVQLAQAGYAEISAALERLTAETSIHYQDLEKLEQRLAALEDKMVAIARSAQTDDQLFDARGELDRQLRPYRGKMTADQLAMLEKQYLDRRLLESVGLPRLSLFYLR